MMNIGLGVDRDAAMRGGLEKLDSVISGFSA
jgi:hypothetical protein